MKSTWKTQLLRIARLFGLAFIGVLIPYVAGLHGTPTIAAIEAVAIIAGEAGFRAIFPSIEAWMSPGPAPTPVHPAQVDAMLKEIFLPVVKAQLDAPNPLVGRLTPSPAVPVATAEPSEQAPVLAFPAVPPAVF